MEALHQGWESFGSLISGTGLVSFLLLELLAVISVPSVLLRRRGRPQAALAWLLALFALPALGVLSWWAFGRTRIERRLRSHLGAREAFTEQHGAPSSTREATIFDTVLPGRARGEYAFATKGNRTKLLTRGEDAFREMEEAISGAEVCVHLLFYIFQWDETGRRVCELLAERAQAGVEVRLLLDGFGSQKTVTQIRSRLSGTGVDVQVFLPSRLHPLYAPRFNFINHRKILTIDNRVAFTGGMNIGREYEHEWKDLMLRIEGPAVEGLNHILLEDWYFATGVAITDPNQHKLAGAGGSDVGVVSSGPDTETWIHDTYFLAMTRAQRRLFIATPYFIPTMAILVALRTAAGRGVDVRIVLPSLSDVRLVMWASRSFYRDLLEAGVRIYEYGDAMLHAKALVKDEDLMSVGTANVDNRSFRLNFEVSCFTSDPDLNAELADWMHALFDKSKEITLESLDEKSTGRKLLESAAHLTSPLL